MTRALTLLCLPVINELPTTFVLPGAYMSNFAPSTLRTSEDGEALVFSLPVSYSSKLPLVYLEKDVGRVVEAIFSLDPSATVGKIYPLTRPTSIQDMVSSYDRAVSASQGKRVVYKQDSDEKFISMISQFRGEEIAKDMFEMFKAYEYLDGKIAPPGREDAVKAEFGIDLSSVEDFLSDVV
jgi:uncharacterized protein YbjT (DUF2867 family)